MYCPEIHNKIVDQDSKIFKDKLTVIGSIGYSGVMFGRIASAIAPIKYGEIASPNACDTKIMVALAMLRLVGMTI